MKRLLSAAIAASTAAGWAWAEDEPHHSWVAPLKDIRLIEDRDDIHLSFGGKLRERVNVFHNDRFGLTTAEDDGYILLHCLLLNADLRMGQHVRAFVELGSHLTTSNDYNPGPFDEDSADLHQAFLDLMYGDTRLRLGRQEMPLNSARLMGTRDGPNVRLAYDGVLLDTTIGNVDLRLFAFNPVDVDEDAFNNRNNDDEALWGINTTYDFGASDANFYYIGLDRNDSRFNQGTADETRHSIGTRFFGTQGRWDWDTELVYQFGDFGSADIRAWTIASDTGYTFEDAAGSPRISVSANIASGDDDPDDNDLNTFNPLQPNLAYFEEAAVLAPQNFYNIEPQIRLQATDKLALSFDWNFFWRLEENDAVYARGLLALPGTATASGHFVAHVPSISVDYRVNRYMTMDFSYSHFFAGEVIDNAGGEDIDYVKLEIEILF